MKLLVNGESSDYTGDAQLSAFINERYPEAKKIAVAVNQQFIPRSQYDSYELKEGDDVEIVAPMQGG